MGILISAPQILAFFEFLPHSFVGGHTGVFAHAALAPWAILSILAEPYAFWPLLGQHAHGLPLSEMSEILVGI